MQKIIGFVLLLCSIFALYTWTFEPDTVVVASAGAAEREDAYGNKVDANGYVVPEYYDDKLSGEFYDAASKPLGFVNDVAIAFDNMRDGITTVITASTKMTETITGTLTSIFNFNEEGSWWDDIWLSFDSNAGEEGGSRGSR